MWVKIRNVLVSFILTEAILQTFVKLVRLNDEKTKLIAARAIVDIKSFVDTKDKRYINQSIGHLQQLIK